MLRQITTGLAWASCVSAAALSRRQTTRDSCPGYALTGVSETSSGFTADLRLAGTPCNVYGTDVQDLKLLVSYDSGLSHTNQISQSYI